MTVKTYRAKTMHEALALVRRELGAKASVLRTREVRAGGLLRWLGGPRLIEVVASTSVSVPSRMPSRRRPAAATATVAALPATARIKPVAPHPAAPSPAARHPAARGPQVASPPDLQTQLNQLQSRVEDLCRRAPPPGLSDWPDAIERLFGELVEAGITETQARELIERVRGQQVLGETHDTDQFKERLAGLIESEISISEPIGSARGRRVVALVGATGVGKTTALAKLAAQCRMRDKRRVGLIAGEDGLSAGVDPLRGCAEIIDLPRQIVATPADMHEALDRLADRDLILIDTAGLSPRDKTKMRELRSLLTAAAPDEIHLVQSSVASAASLLHSNEQFSALGATALLLTKLDEATSLGNLLPLVRGGLPISYLTDGQRVPDDLRPAEAGRLARALLGMPPVGSKVPTPPDSVYEPRTKSPVCSRKP